MDEIFTMIAILAIRSCLPISDPPYDETRDLNRVVNVDIPR